MLGSDYYETMDECAFVPGCLPMGIGAGSTVRKTLIDKNARIGENVKILNKEGVVENFSTESKGWVIRDGELEFWDLGSERFWGQCVC
jgi:glucose-1-phosphate adenylyltransferase